MTTCLYNGRFFRHADSAKDEEGVDFADFLVIDDESGTIKFIGNGDIQRPEDCTVKLDMKNHVVTSGFIDGHMHLLQTGESLNKLDISKRKSLEEIRTSIRQYASEKPDLVRILVKGWLQASTEGRALAKDLDDLDGRNRPIYIGSEDSHSAWLNTAALEEIGAKNMEDPPGGKIARDECGNPTGLLSETAALGFLWPYLSKITSPEERMRNIRDAFDAYISSGYTGLVELATEPTTWDSLVAFRDKQPGKRLPIDLAAHWLILPSNSTEEDLRNVDRAIELHKTHNVNTSRDFRIAGIKVLLDGVVDSCTAAMQQPYSHNASLTGNLLWQPQQLMPVLQRASGAGLQIAMHAIGDKAIKLAVDSLEKVGNATARHRIEHLETCSPEDAKRLGPLGITASIQPAHLDPALMEQWDVFLGPERVQQVFPYSEMALAGAQLALGTDSPTAPLLPLPNLYVATTRRSSRQPQRTDRTSAKYALGLAAALSGATYGSAYASFADGWTGSLAPGMAANLAVVDMSWNASELLQATVTETWFEGKRIWPKK
ncbi:hypothetical protein CP532_1113 [Ophiocordyceps camponoti-leonardi (nom. inval.)]|nr:hypothetical protein CP532_1113 [Ophiocordyceps camponoti-leonardi (nom. inval.)]